VNLNILVTASALSDQDLLARLETLAGEEREASVELIAHLAALDSRPALFLAHASGFGFPDPDLGPPAGKAPHRGEPPVGPREGQGQE
jgi:hypothetical protein